MLIRLWREGELFGTKGTFLGAWFVLAAAIQLFAPTVGIWILGLLAQVGPAIVLVLKERIDNIF